jgi:Flp pilus assembly pilin Flp
MTQWIYQFWREEDGQDLIEYSLLITFIALATMWIMGSGRPAVNAIWTGANTTITQANTTAGS